MSMGPTRSSAGWPGWGNSTQDEDAAASLTDIVFSYVKQYSTQDEDPVSPNDEDGIFLFAILAILVVIRVNFSMFPTIFK